MVLTSTLHAMMDVLLHDTPCPYDSNTYPCSASFSLCTFFLHIISLLFSFPVSLSLVFLSLSSWLMILGRHILSREISREILCG
jgi:hypothetical protein